MRIAYGKLGRSIPLTMEDAGSIGGDIEVVRLLDILRSEHEVHIVGRNRANVDIPGVVNHWQGTFDEMPVPSRCHTDPEYQAFVSFLKERTARLPEFDAWVIWLGQNGSSLHCVPATQKKMLGQMTQPLISLINYGYPLVHMVNQLGVKPFWLCPDPRNTIKFRDLWDPQQRPILAQFNATSGITKGTNSVSFYDERDGKLRKGTVKYVYSGIEMLAVPPQDRPTAVPPLLFGLLVNEGPTNVPNRRVDLVQKWCKGEYEIYGHWTQKSMGILGRDIYPIEVHDVRSVLQRWKATMTFPASNSGWATAKPWECFAAGTICFKHPLYDVQGHIYGKHMPEELREFLCPIFSSQLESRLEELRDDTRWRYWADLQFDYYQASRTRLEDGYSALRETLDGIT